MVISRLREKIARRRAAGSKRGRTQEEVIPAPFIVGVGRSGTTLLRLMLDAHPDLAVPPETHFIPQAARACERASDSRRAFLKAVVSHRRWGDFGLEDEELRRSISYLDPFDVGEALRLFYRLYAERFGKPRWGDKTPGYVRRMALIKELLPEAHFVHVVRDGRDVALSHKDLWFGPDSIEEAAHWWRDWILEAREQARSLEYYLEIRYEDLVLDTEPTLRKVCEFVQLTWDPAILEYHKTAEERMRELYRNIPASSGKDAVRGADRTGIHALTGMPPQRSRVERWRTQMEEADCKRFEEIAGSTLREFGYKSN